jgi:inorganic pyrophosphatase
MPSLLHLASHDREGQLRVVIEAPRGSRAKFKYDPIEQVFELGRPLCLGMAYPYDWGFIPSTRADDGDALDAMVYHDVPSYPGIIIPSKPIGVVRLVEKDKGGPRQRNDRIIVVPADEKRWDDATALEKRVRQELGQFFLNVVVMTGKKVRVEGWEGPKAAQAIIDKAVKAYDRGKATKDK